MADPRRYDTGPKELSGRHGESISPGPQRLSTCAPPKTLINGGRVICVDDFALVPPPRPDRFLTPTLE